MTAYPPAMRYLTPCAANALNRSLKCEFGVTPTLHPVRLNYHLPGRGEDGGSPLALPKLHVEAAVALAHFAETFHEERVGRAGSIHRCYLMIPCVVWTCNRLFGRAQDETDGGGEAVPIGGLFVE